MKNKLLSIIILSLFVLTACSDFLDEAPIRQIASDEYFDSENALKVYANGFLEKYLPSAATLTRGDEFSDICVTTQTEGFLKSGYSAEEANNWNTSHWEQLYNVNYFLGHLHEAEGKVDDSTLKHYEGVGRFWRAWFYWEKVKTFGDVPWYGDVIDPEDEEQLYKGRDSRRFVMEKVLDDLNFAATYCSDHSKYLNANVVNKYVALALKARVCLFEGTYRKYHVVPDYEPWLRECVSACEEMMKNSPYALVANSGEEELNYSSLFKSQTPLYQEIILANEMTAELDRVHDASWYYTSGTAGQRNSATKAFINMYLNLDGTRFTDKTDYNKTDFSKEFQGRDYRLKQTIIGSDYKKLIGGVSTTGISKTLALGSQLTYYRIAKWNMDDDQYESRTNSPNSLSVFRFAEILLNYAEAKAELGELGMQEWNKSIRLLRERSGVNGKEPDTYDSYLSDYYWSGNAGEAKITDKWLLEARRERAIEMFMENVRRDDLMRWKMGPKLVVEMAGIYIPQVGKSFDLDGDGKNDICFYSSSITKPATESGVTYVQITAQEGDAATTFGLNADNCLVYKLERLWEERRYLYPVPKKAININPNLLPQNPGWGE